jgi:predicted ATP-grasp superfamily ATP-dependent carboligase
VRIFLYEYTSVIGSSKLSALRMQGRAMLCAVAEDFSRLAGVEVSGIVDESREFLPAGGQFRPIPPQEEEAAFRDLAGKADYTLVIAPEFNNILAARCRWVEEVNGRLLGPTAAAIRLTGDKLALEQHLRKHKTPTPPCEVFVPGKFKPSFPFPLVCKPRFGAGSLATFLIQDHQELTECQQHLQDEGWEGEMLAEPFVPGQAASVAFLIGPQQQLALLPAAQNLSGDGRFHYSGGTVPLPVDLAQRAVFLASKALEAVPGLGGYIGLDLVLGGEDDGSQDWLIEINPRLTTSYIGLRALAKSNLAWALLRLAEGEILPPVNWHPGLVHFRPDGSIQKET